MSTAIQILEGQIDELVDALADMVGQHCSGPNEAGEYDTNALSANAEAVDLLKRFGRVEIIRGCGRMTIFKWKTTVIPTADGEW